MQQVDTQGPVVVERISTQFADIACTPANARAIIEGLHGGTAVTLSADGKTATFTPTAKLGYGESYIALALAAEALRNAGVTSCATPEQWKAVFMGGPLAAAGTTSTTTSRSATASSSSSFPGILVLKQQGQGWGQIAQTTNVQLGQVVSSARSSLNVKDSSSSLSPTGRSSADMEKDAKAGSTPGANAASSSTDRSFNRGRDDEKKDDNARDNPTFPDNSGKSGSQDDSSSATRPSTPGAERSNN